MSKEVYGKKIQKEREFWDKMTLGKNKRERKYMWDDPKINDICTGYYKKRLINLASANKGGRVLEIACGEGWLSLELAKRGMRVDAYDIAKVRIEEAKRNLYEAKRRGQIISDVRYEVKDLNTAILPEGYYDFVISYDGLHHIPKVERFFEEIIKSLKENGKVVIWDHIRHFEKLSKVLMGLIYFFLPTNMPYDEKLRWYLQIIVGKASSDRFPDTELSPFEDSGMADLRELLLRYFKALEVKETLSFVRPIVGRLRLLEGLLYFIIRILKVLDDSLVSLCLLRGEYIFFYGEKK